MSLHDRIAEALLIRAQKKCPPGFRKNRETGHCERIRINVRPRRRIVVRPRTEAVGDSLYDRVTGQAKHA